MSELSRPDLAIALNAAIPEEIASEALDILADAGTPATLLRLPGGPYAGLELFLPSAAALFIASNYFGGIFKKLGEEHSQPLKQAAMKLFRRSRGLSVVARGTVGKVKEEGPGQKSFSLAYSIRGQVAAGLSYKFVLVHDIDLAEADQGISAFIDLLRDINAGSFDADLLACQPIGGVVIVTYDAEAGKIVPVDVLAEIRAKAE